MADPRYMTLMDKYFEQNPFNRDQFAEIRENIQTNHEAAAKRLSSPIAPNSALKDRVDQYYSRLEAGSAVSEFDALGFANSPATPGLFGSDPGKWPASKWASATPENPLFGFNPNPAASMGGVMDGGLAVGTSTSSIAGWVAGAVINPVAGAVAAIPIIGVTAQAAVLASVEPENYTHKVASGDRLYDIAEQAGLTDPKDIQRYVEHVAHLNGMTGVEANHLEIDQELKLPINPHNIPEEAPKLDWRALDVDSGRLRGEFNHINTQIAAPEKDPVAIPGKEPGLQSADNAVNPRDFIKSTDPNGNRIPSDPNAFRF